ncbi:hypothetical protein PR048_026567 [Dryococelus australis]|uniref:Uncharacterized protein n=1 Tax=Dryococelus australis TaxID=614101 RepID=A0ABQ9GLQ0_9NEOP|nr:hypothetical protein PR048_026567 [Dryococelus australis]
MKKQLQKKKTVRQITTVTLWRPWLEADEDEPSFQILNEEEIVASVTEEAKTWEDEEEESTIMVSKVKRHLNFVIQYVEQSANENVFAYYEHLWHLHQLLIEAISSKLTQQKIKNFFQTNEYKQLT